MQKYRSRNGWPLDRFEAFVAENKRVVSALTCSMLVSRTTLLDLHLQKERKVFDIQSCPIKQGLLYLGLL